MELGPWICTNLRARSSPVVVTVTANLPSLTGAVRSASDADAVDGHLYHAIGPAITRAAMRIGSQRLRRCCIFVTSSGWVGIGPRPRRHLTPEVLLRQF